MGASSSSLPNYNVAGYAILTLDIVLTTAAVMGRVASRRLQKMSWSIDDILTYIAYSGNLGILITGLCLTRSGGLNWYRIQQQHQVDSQSVRASWISLGVLYIFTITFIKLSILFLYRRTFTMFQAWFHYAWWGLMHLTVLWTIACTILLVIRYAPVKPPFEFSRISISITGLVNGISDILLVVMPAFLISGMKLHTRQKVALISIFAIGGIASIVSIIRAAVFFANRNLSMNEAYSNYLDIVLTATESSAGLMCACLPLTKPLVIRFTRWIQHVIGLSTEHQGWTTVTQSQKSVGKVSASSDRTIVRVYDYQIEMSSVTAVDSKNSSASKKSQQRQSTHTDEPWRNTGPYGTQTRCESRPTSPSPGQWEWQRIHGLHKG